MQPEEARARAASFDEPRVAQVYADHRPGYPAEVVRWLVGTQATRVLELGAGTGKLTAGIAALGHDVVAIDPSTAMLHQLARALPAVAAGVGRAEQIPLRASSVDVVVVGQAFHLFDQERALPEIARVLRPGGVLALAWNVGDRTVPWVRKLLSLLGDTGAGSKGDPVEDSELFTTTESRVFRHWQQFHRGSLTGFAESSSYVAVMAPAERRQLLDLVGELYDGYGRGPDGMLMPWLAMAYRTRVSGLAQSRRTTPEGSGSSTSKPSDGLDDGLLIDFP